MIIMLILDGICIIGLGKRDRIYTYWIVLIEIIIPNINHFYPFFVRGIFGEKDRKWNVLLYIAITFANKKMFICPTIWVLAIIIHHRHLYTHSSVQKYIAPSYHW